MSNSAPWANYGSAVLPPARPRSWVSLDQVRALLGISGIDRIARENLLDVTVSCPSSEHLAQIAA